MDTIQSIISALHDPNTDIPVEEFIEIISDNTGISIDDAKKEHQKWKDKQQKNEFKISNFFFKTRNCETKDYRKCLLWFGNKGNKVKISWVKYYRIINGPIPTKSTCIKGKPVWFQDIPFPNNKDLNINILKFFRKFNYQNKEKMYFNEPIIKTFNYFSQSDKSLGVLVQSKNFKGIRKKQIYIFDTEGDNFEVVKPLCTND